MKRRWQFQEAKARLSELVRAAVGGEGPQEITVRGKPAAVLVSSRDYERLAGRRESFVQFMQGSPLVGVDLKIRRDKSPARGSSL